MYFSHKIWYSFKHPVIGHVRLRIFDLNSKPRGQWSYSITLQISPRNRQTDYPYGADAPKADVPGPLNNFRPRFGDPLPQHIRDVIQVFIFCLLYSAQLRVLETRTTVSINSHIIVIELSVNEHSIHIEPYHLAAVNKLPYFV